MCHRDRVMGRLEKEDGCSVHGQPAKRGSCASCNAAYMRRYLRRRRLSDPEKEMRDRARERARKTGVQFSIDVSNIVIPRACPVLGIPLIIGGSRSPNSPALDRLDPDKGYVAGNVRVISDRANKLKSNCSIEELRRRREQTTSQAIKSEYDLVIAYIRREAVLLVAKERSNRGRAKRDWQAVAALLSEICVHRYTLPDR